MGGYYQFDLKNSDQETFTFIYKRTMHGSAGMDIKSSEVLDKLRVGDYLAISTMGFNIPEN